MKRFSILLVLSIFPCFLNAQPLVLPKINQPPLIDGQPDEPVWQQAALFSAFTTIQPDYGLQPSETTELRLAYDDKAIYVAFRCFDRSPDQIRGTLSDRDQVDGDDWVAFCIDPFNDELGGFFFLSNPLGVQMDGTLDANAEPDILLDMNWQCTGLRTPEGYSVEMAIPFSSLRFPNLEELVMGFKAARFISRKSEEADYPDFSPNKGAALTQFQKISLSGIRSKRAVELIPSITLSENADREEGRMAYHRLKPDAGLTAKIGIGSGLTLDAAINPDFAQVETDAGQIDVNLRNALYYTEKRPFFLERQEWFDIGATSDISPLQQIVHTRAIADPAVGLKLSGKIGRSGLISTLYALDTYRPEGAEPLKTHFSALRYARVLKADSYLGGILAAKFQGRSHFITGGIDGRVRLNNQSALDWHAVGSRNSGTESLKGVALGASWSFNTRRWEARVAAYHVSPDFRADFGYITRTGLTSLPVYVGHHFLQSEKIVQRITPYYWSRHSHDQMSGIWETFNILGIEMAMPRQTECSIDFRLANEVFAGRRFNRNGIRMEGETQLFNFLALEASFLKGNRIYYDPSNPFQGRGTEIEAGIALQPRSWINIALSWARSDFFRAENGEKIYDYTLYRNRTNILFHKKLSFRVIAEYNAFKKQLNGNFLLAYTYAPGTVVYLGYGSLYEGLEWQDGQYRSSDRLLNTRQTWFFKASYLWRL